MKIQFTFFVFLSVVLLFPAVCTINAQQHKNDEMPEQPGLERAKAIFERLKADRKFQKEMGMKGEPYAAIENDYSQIIWGDLNNDSVSDALLPFRVYELEGGSNLVELYYAVFISKNQKLEYAYSYSRGNHWLLDFPVVTFNKIENGKIYGKEDYYENLYFEDYPDWIYSLRNGIIEKEYEPLHPVLNRDFAQKMVEYLCPYGIKKSTTFAGSDGKLTKLKRAFGNTLKIITITTDQCDGYFMLPYSDDYRGTFRNAELPYAVFEINDKDSVALKQIRFNEPGVATHDLILCTFQGYITEKTTLAEFKKVFPKSYATRAEIDNDIYVFMAMEEDENTDESHWVVIFDKNGKIKSVGYWGAC